MDEKVIVAFAKWMQKKDPQYAKIPTEYLAQQLDQLLQTEEGLTQLKPLIDEFKKDIQGGMFKSGGKLDQAAERLKAIEKGGDGLKIVEDKTVGIHRPTVSTLDLGNGEIEIVAEHPVFKPSDGVYVFEDRRGNIYDGATVIPAANNNPYAQTVDTRVIDGNTATTLFVSPDKQDSTYVAVRNGYLGPEINMARSTKKDREYVAKSKQLREKWYVPGFVASLYEMFGPDMSNYNAMRESHRNAIPLIKKK